ncbi:UNVERIFIED_CONTAM: Glycosyltransferase BC10 [Sesamum angustifolium]|uniref:Glycosyltransferase BC10 n=1 Tax=Sesamum angustifolium TaxID=2727405 RepID=A0AAW2PBL8_9LAMI
MTKKAQASLKPGLSMRHVLCLGWKLVILVSLVLCLLAFLRIQQYSRSTDSSFSAALPRKSLVLGYQFRGTPKIAFLFLLRRNLPLDFLWENFFENVDKRNFSIYIHSEPGFVFDESTTRSTVFFDRQLKNSIKVAWGEASMIEAERLLFEAALEDPANQRFVLLSDSCVPLYNFSYIYKYLMDSPRSFVDSFLDKKDVRYNPKMSPVIPKKKWRKGSQWVTLTRRHAEVIVDDEIVFQSSESSRRPPIDASRGKMNLKLQKQHNCIPDEHYVQTLLADINHVFYETEFRTEWCSNNSTSVPCFLFARKFSQGAAMRLLSQGIVGNFDVSTLLEPPP